MKPRTRRQTQCEAKRTAMCPNADAKMNLLSGYHGDPPLLVSPLSAMRSAAGGRAVNYA